MLRRIGFGSALLIGVYGVGQLRVLVEQGKERSLACKVNEQNAIHGKEQDNAVHEDAERRRTMAIIGGNVILAHRDLVNHEESQGIE